MKLIKRYRFFIITIGITALLMIVNRELGIKALQVTGYSFKEMLLVIPPIFVLLGLLDCLMFACLVNN